MQAMSMTAEPTQPPVPSPAHGAATMLTDTVFPKTAKTAGKTNPQLPDSELQSRTAPASLHHQKQEICGAIGTAANVCTAGIQHRHDFFVKLLAVS